MVLAGVRAALQGPRMVVGDARGVVDSGCAYQAGGAITAAIDAGVDASIDASVLACCNTAALDPPHPHAEHLDGIR